MIQRDRFVDEKLLLLTSDDFLPLSCCTLIFLDHAKPSRNFLEYNRVPWTAPKNV